MLSPKDNQIISSILANRKNETRCQIVRILDRNPDDEKDIVFGNGRALIFPERIKQGAKSLLSPIQTKIKRSHCLIVLERFRPTRTELFQCTQEWELKGV